MSNMRRMRTAVIVLAALVAGCGEQQKQKQRPLVCHVGGTMRPVMEALAKMYSQRTGEAIEINSAGSGELLAHIESHQSGDLYVCHDPFLDILMARGLGRAGWTVAELTPVIVVAKGNPKNIRGLADAVRPGVSLVLTDLKKSTLGWMLPTIFAKAGLDLEAVIKQPNVQTFRKGGQAANLVKTGNADAAIVWNAVAHLRLDGLDVVPITAEQLPAPGVDTVTTPTPKTYYLAPVRVTVATLQCSQRPDAAVKLAEFVASKEASAVFRKFGFTAASRKEPQRGSGAVALRLYAGAGLRRAVDELAAEFEKASGIRVEPDYGGSGMIISRARLDDRADLFMPGDVWYVDQLAKQAGLIESKTMVAYFVPVIIVRKGEQRIRGLEDFFDKDVKVALGNPKACQVGRISEKIFAKAGLDASKLEAKQSLTVNELGVWVKVGDVDAAIVWDAIAANIVDSVDVVEIPPAQNIISRVVVGLMTTSTNKPAARRFIDFMTGPAGRAILEGKGYRTTAPQ